MIGFFYLKFLIVVYIDFIIEISVRVYSFQNIPIARKVLFLKVRNK